MLAGPVAATEPPDNDADLIGVVAATAQRLHALADAHATKHRFAAGLCGREVVDLGAQLPGARYADILAWRDSKLVSVMASAGFPEVLDEIRVETGEGPCYETAEQPGPVVCADLLAAERWPEFAQRAAEASDVRSIASFRVHLPSGDIGALSLYSDWPFGFDDLTLAMGGLLAGCYSLQSRLAML